MFLRLHYWANACLSTADIQTVSLILSHISSRKVKDARVLKWVAVYRDMLDQWGLWKERAKLDVQRVPTLDSKPPAQVRRFIVL